MTGGPRLSATRRTIPLSPCSRRTHADSMSCRAFVPRLAGELLQPLDVAAARHHAIAGLECKSPARGHGRAAGRESSLRAVHALPTLAANRWAVMHTPSQPRTATMPSCPAALRAPSAASRRSPGTPVARALQRSCRGQGFPLCRAHAARVALCQAQRHQTPPVPPRREQTHLQGQE